jgi:hypothetical protein
MPRVDIIMDLGQDYLFEDDREPKRPKHNQEKRVRITGELFDKAVKEGLIEKTADGYVFVGKYEDVKKLKKRKS